MPLHAAFSNQLEALFDALCARLAARPRDPFTRDTVIAPSAAVQRWLQLRLAAQRGIAANLDTPFLAPWLHGLIREASDAEPLGAAWPWRVYELLVHPKLLREQPRLAHSLGDPQAAGAEGLRWERAQAVAAQLERLGLERPDWLAAWRERRLVTGHADEPWLAALWRAAGDEAGDLLARRLERLRGLALPGPVHLFALPRIAPLHWQALRGLQGELCLYALNPCREYWFDLVSPRRLARLRAQQQDGAHEVGHPLLALNAQPSQQQLQQLAEAGLFADEGDYREPAGDTLLARLQRGLLNLDGEAPEPAASGDRSLELHVCHSLRRELEVLHDRLLGLVAFDPGLQLADILVLCPDLERAAPLIDAVFGSMPAERSLAYAISGQAEPPLPAALQRPLAVLDLLDSAAPHAQLAGLLGAAVRRGRGGLDAGSAAGRRPPRGPRRRACQVAWLERRAHAGRGAAAPAAGLLPARVGGRLLAPGRLARGAAEPGARAAGPPAGALPRPCRGGGAKRAAASARLLAGLAAGPGRALAAAVPRNGKTRRPRPASACATRSRAWARPGSAPA